MPKRHAVYVVAGGAIRQFVTCLPHHAALQAGPGEAVLEVAEDVTDATHRIVDGAAVLIE